MSCVTGKRAYDSKEQAEEALISTRARNGYRDNSGPIAIYQCDDCGLWHFTSQGPESSILKSPEVQKRIKDQYEAEYWSKKLGF